MAQAMPLFEYVCKACAHEFEVLVRGEIQPECPACHAATLERRLSTFAARTTGPASSVDQIPAGGCGHCGDPRGPGSCSIN
jgi:putative FmdB family regulatory protein